MSPFKSVKQRKYLFANLPDVAEKFAEHTPKGKKLPERAKEPPHNSKRPRYPREIDKNPRSKG